MPTSPHICILCFCPLLLQNSFKAHIPTHQHSDSLSTRAHPPTPSLFFVLIILLSTSSAFVALYYHASLLPCLPTTMPPYYHAFPFADTLGRCAACTTMLYTQHVPYVICTMLYTPCCMPHVPQCYIRSTCLMLYAPCYTHHVIHTMLYAPCALCYIRTTCLMLYTHQVPYIIYAPRAFFLTL
jgi:hypothetical protein